MTATCAAAFGLVFLVAITAFALVFTRTHPTEQENPWQPTPPSDQSTRPTL